jgi:enamine deaminase RidA (YjgF/YER057c/UK114 family)
MAVAAGIRVEYLPLAACVSARWDDVLGLAIFAGEAGAHAVPSALIRTPVLSHSGEPMCEIWRSAQALQSGRSSRVHYRYGDDLLFGCISLAESEGLHAATAAAYREVFATLERLGFPYLLRVWNYLPQINVEMQGTERYWQFNSGRRSALIDTGHDVVGNVPAACALGSTSGSPLVVYFLASRNAPTLVENPRQVSAYQYPPQYGPKPVFSRASVWRDSSGATLFISGTASIVGHRTLHLGDVAAQTRETLTNIEALLEEANRVSQNIRSRGRFGLDTLAYKVYVRNSADLRVIQSQLQAGLGNAARIIYLQADICRPDLLVEIEATGKEST